jgi:hypothetical protein
MQRITVGVPLEPVDNGSHHDKKMITTTIPIVAKNNLDGDTNHVRIENTNDRGAPFEMTFRPPQETALRLGRDGRQKRKRGRPATRACRHEEDGDVRNRSFFFFWIGMHFCSSANVLGTTDSTPRRRFSGALCLTLTRR